MNIRPYTDALRKHAGGGWTKSYESRADNTRIVCFEKTVGNRLVDVQLYGDGGHRVTHMLNGRRTTVPTDFKTPSEMIKAIQHELSRKDQS